jgi:hypothetical protein
LRNERERKGYGGEWCRSTGSLFHEKGLNTCIRVDSGDDAALILKEKCIRFNHEDDLIKGGQTNKQ